jgi:hypothetical protein
MVGITSRPKSDDRREPTNEQQKCQVVPWVLAELLQLDGCGGNRAVKFEA